MLGLHLVEYKRPWLFREDFVARHFASLTDQDLLRFNREVNRAGRVVVAPYTSDGARRDGLPAKVNLIATYGDSHTAGAEVDDRETWQFYLEKQLGYEVKNFGVGGYSTDQALLKFEKNVARGEISPIVILGVFEENINRIVNQFRSFYRPMTQGDFGFKPIFQIKQGRLELVPNPLTPEAASIADAEETARRPIQTDYWAKQNLQNRFPYIVQIPGLLEVVWQELQRLRLAYPAWHDDGVSDLMSMINIRFVATAEAAGVQPVGLFKPHVAWWREGRREPDYAGFKDELRRRHPDVPVIDIAEHEFAEEHFNIVPFAGHASAYGNQQIARALAQSLRWKGFDFAKLSDRSG